jgi:hypothetical protein
MTRAMIDVDDQSLPLRDRLLGYIRQVDYVTFAELANRFADHFRNGQYEISKPGNIVLWQGVTREASDALAGLLSDGSIVMRPTQLLTYLIDGCTLKMPMVKSVRQYKTPHWLPAVLRPAENVEARRRRKAA